MNSLLLGLLAETAIHSGAGQSTGVIDLPVAREAATDYPVVPGSGVKGALRDFFRDNATDTPDKTDFIFGKTDNAGALLISDARLLLLPIRSLDSAYKWVTCPHLLERFQRDSSRTSTNSLQIPPFAPKSDEYIGNGNDAIFLEERQFSKAKNTDPDAIEKLSRALEKLISHHDTRKRLSKQIVIISDDDFTWFARNGLGVQARNVLDEKTKESRNLWYEEFVPADSLFYAILAERNPNALETVKTLLSKTPYIQLGGNETVGMGWFSVSIN